MPSYEHLSAQWFDRNKPSNLTQILRSYHAEKTTITTMTRTMTVPMANIGQTEHIEDVAEDIETVEEDPEAIEADTTEETSKENIKMTTSRTS